MGVTMMICRQEMEVVSFVGKECEEAIKPPPKNMLQEVPTATELFQQTNVLEKN